jgi:hypothetical protein
VPSAFLEVKANDPGGLASRNAPIATPVAMATTVVAI